MSNNQTTVKVTADASGYTAELDRASKSAAAFSATQAQAAQRVQVAQQAIAEAATNGSSASARAISNFVSQLARTADQAGKTRAEVLQMRAAQLGIADSVSSYVSQIDAASAATHEFSLNSSAARRELLVLAHEASQGNWTRFAGSMGVLAERTDALSMILSPVGAGLLAAGAAAAYFIDQIVKGYEQIDAFNRSIASTNGYIGLSSAQMAEMSNGLQDSVNHLSSVREAMAQVASTGAFTADNLQLATRAALAMSDDIGVGTDKAAESLAQIQDNVLEWIAKYQSAHHAFTAAQVEEIDNFVKQGDTASAVKAVMQDLSSAHQKIADDANKNMGAVLAWWHQWGDVIDKVKESVRGIGVPASVDTQVGDQYARVEAAQRNLKQQQSMGGMDNIASAQQALDIETQKLDVLRQQQTAINTQQRAREAAAKGGDAKVAVDSYLNSDKYANPSQQHTQALGAENAAFTKATANLEKLSADYQAALKRHYENVEQINSEYAKKTRVHTSENGANTQIASLTAQNAALEEHRKSDLAQAKADYQTGSKDYLAYYQTIRDTNAQYINEEIVNSLQRVDIAGSKKEGAAQQEALKVWLALVAQRVAAEQDYTNSLAKYAADRAASVQKYADQQSSGVQKQADSYNQQDDTRYMTPTQKSNSAAELQIRDAYYQEVEQLKEKYGDTPLQNQQEYQSKLLLAAQTFAEHEQMNTQHLANMADMNNSYTDQMHAAVTKLGGDGQTNAQMVASGFTTAWQDSANALDQFITTGKGNFDTFTAGILADLAKIALHQAEMQLFQAIGTAAFSTGGPVGSYASGGPISGSGTATSDSIPAMLSNGEYVINASATSKYRGLLDSINSGGMSHFASGGAVGSVSSSGGGSASHTDLHMHVNGGGLTSDDLKTLAPAVQAMIDRRITQRSRGQGGLSYQIKYGQI